MPECPSVGSTAEASGVYGLLSDPSSYARLAALCVIWGSSASQRHIILSFWELVLKRHAFGGRSTLGWQAWHHHSS